MHEHGFIVFFLFFKCFFLVVVIREWVREGNIADVSRNSSMHIVPNLGGRGTCSLPPK